MKTILLVDDEKRMLDLLELYIAPHGYECVKKQNGLEAVSFFETGKADLVLLDVMMPDLDGWATCKKIREFSNVPIIMLTARDSKEDVIKGFKNGADDYVTKPFDEDELLARMAAVLRRAKNDLDHQLPLQGLIINEDAFEVTFQKSTILFTPKEFSLLALFLRNPNQVFSRDHLLSILWSLKSDTEDRTIDSHIRNIREKLRRAGFPVEEHLKTVWGLGYKWIYEDTLLSKL